MLVCWVNPRIPNYCPECGTHVFLKMKFEGYYPDPQDAWLTVSDERK